ncbi:hypothetical protein E2C01_093933 [Portunus trituberculatus]|uniref:Uncharacterized protein n=1 Tax=Portunus trituberculatus TaxID=210409 RepID=A0A5B7JUU2_PORTR|nr:hypothetical protein [Portunus trituberculatus]
MEGRTTKGKYVEDWRETLAIDKAYCVVHRHATVNKVPFPSACLLRTSCEAEYCRGEHYDDTLTHNYEDLDPRQPITHEGCQAVCSLEGRRAEALTRL